jgi:hypothetical protein
MRTHTDPRCTGCTQDLLRDCREALAVNPTTPVSGTHRRHTRRS